MNVSWMILGLAAALASQALPAEDKIKEKGGRTVVQDKSKPVRQAIEEWYGRNVAAFRAKDVEAVMALRTDDFHTILPDGTRNTREDMRGYTERFLGRIDHFISLDFQIGTIEIDGEVASADVTQKTVRMQRLPDGTLHKVEARAVQRESWKKTAADWKLYRVDQIRDLGVFVDDQPYDPAP